MTMIEIYLFFNVTLAPKIIPNYQVNDFFLNAMKSSCHQFNIQKVAKKILHSITEQQKFILYNLDFINNITPN